MQIRNRIMEQRLVHPDEVAPNPRNWRVHPQHQRDALRGVLAEVGIVAPVIAYHSERAGGRLMLVDGHERMTVGVPFPCVILDVSDTEADKLLATFDPIANLATANVKALEELVASFELDSPAVADMLDALLQQPGVEPAEAIDTIAPEEFQSYDETLETQYCCPKCRYEWSGKPK